MLESDSGCHICSMDGVVLLPVSASWLSHMGLMGCPSPVPTRWWRGSQRWSFNTLWQSYRATLWTRHEFRPLLALTTNDWGTKETLFRGLKNSIFASTRI
jgi:hypothetical protein